MNTYARLWPQYAMLESATKLLALVLLLQCSAGVASSSAPPAATFALQDKTGLPDGHKIYVLGFSSAPGFYLNSDGTWLDLPQQAKGQIPCFEMGSGGDRINQVIIDSSQPTLSARVYFFVDDQGVYPPCNNGTTSAPTDSQDGIFGTKDFSYTWSSKNGFGVTGIKQTSIGPPHSGIPVYAYSEIGPGPKNGTIDVSQVDLYSFPVTIRASVLPGNPDVVGNPFDAADADSSIHFSDNVRYKTFMNNLAGKDSSCTADPGAPSCAYLDLVSAYGDYSILLNPGGFLNSNTKAAQKSSLRNAFDNIITTLWATGAPTITLNNGGVQGAAPQDTLVATAMQMTYPCNDTGTGCPTVQALKFVGQHSGYVAYLFSPIDYAKGCAAKSIKGCPAGSIASSGNQVFSGSGVFGTTAVSEYNNMVKIQGTGTALLPEQTTQYGVGSYAAQVARLGLIMTQALNHGAFSQCPAPYSWTCLNLQTKWYPVQTDSVSQNLFSQFVHTASNAKGIPFFVRPPNPVKSAGGMTMGMAYGFSNDEMPTPAVPGAPNPEVPAKMDGTVVYDGPGPYTITLGPWQ